MRTLSYLWALLSSNLKSWQPEIKRVFIMSLFMMIQNSMFFVLWVLFFTKVSDIAGWKLADMSRMIGIVASAIGLSLFLFNGIRSIPYRLSDGTIDAFLTKPRHPLPALLFSSSGPASLGDVFYGPLLWITLGDVTRGSEWGLLILMTLLSTLIVTATITLFYSAAFWMKGNTRFSEQLFEMLVITTTLTTRGQPLGIKVIIFTVIPAGFTTLLPTMLVREFDWGLFAILLAAAVFYSSLAITVFNAGVRHYKSSA